MKQENYLVVMDEQSFYRIIEKEGETYSKVVARFKALDKKDAWNKFVEQMRNN